MSIATGPHGAMPDNEIGHPSPRRGSVGLLLLGVAVFGAPAGWLTQMLLSYGLASHACYPEWNPLGTPIWPWLHTVLAVVALLGLMTAIVSGFIARRAWHATRSEHGGASQHLLDVGEGRSRFLAMCGLMMSVGFFTLLVFTSLTLMMVPACGR
jgi:hypothetical protein